MSQPESHQKKIVLFPKRNCLGQGPWNSYSGRKAHGSETQEVRQLWHQWPSFHHWLWPVTAPCPWAHGPPHKPQLSHLQSEVIPPAVEDCAWPARADGYKDGVHAWSLLLLSHGSWQTRSLLCAVASLLMPILQGENWDTKKFYHLLRVS